MSFARFQEIVQRLTEAATWDKAALEVAREELTELESIVSALKQPDLDGLLKGAILMTGLIPRLDPIEAEDCQRMVVRLVQITLRRLRALRNARKKDLAKRPGSGGTGDKKGSGKVVARPGMQLGDVLIQLGFIKPEDLERALVIAKREKKMIGNVLVSLGLCEREDVARAVFLQKNLQPILEPKEDGEDSEEETDPGVLNLLLGEALLRRGWVNPEELLSALRYQKERNIKIGEALVELGYVTRVQVSQALAWQTELRAKRMNQAVTSPYAPPPKPGLETGAQDGEEETEGQDDVEDASAKKTEAAYTELSKGLKPIQMGLDAPDLDAPHAPASRVEKLKSIRLDDDEEEAAA